MKKEKKPEVRKGVESSNVKGPCPECGGLALTASATWKGGGYNMNGTSAGGQSSQVQENFIKSLQQQIKILELEISFLKKHQKGEAQQGQKTETIQQPDDPEAETHDETVKKLKSEIQAGMVRQEHIRLEKEKVDSKLKMLEQYREDEKVKFIEKISKLTGRVETLTEEGKLKEERCSSLLEDLEKQTIISRDRERQVHQLNEQLDGMKEETAGMKQQLDQAQQELTSRQTAIQQLQDKFLGSSNHILQETIRNLEQEIKTCNQQLKDSEIKLEEISAVKERMESVKVTLLDENSGLRGELAKLKAELQSEVRIRESRDTRTTLEAQELLLSREREANLRLEVSRLQNQTEKLNEKLKEQHEAMVGDRHSLTTIDLKNSTYKSRIAELEGLLSLAGEQTNNIRKQNLAYLDREESLRRELELQEREIQQLTLRLAQTEARLVEADARVESLKEQQKERWDQFCKMADSMKTLSTDMYEQGKCNKNEAKY